MNPEEEDVALKLLHTADWHLGRRFPGFKRDDRDDELRLTRARLEAVDRILDLADQWRVDAVLCAGDLFDDPEPEAQWWEPLVERFRARSRIERPIFLLPGNHDPLTPRCVYSADHPFRRALPEGVHVVDRDDYVFELGPEAVLYAACCGSRAGERDLALALPQREDGDERLRIGMVHGQTLDVPGRPHFPVALDAAVRRGFDYLALGHNHGFREVTAGASPIVYPGTPEPTRFGEQGAGHVAIVFFPRGRRSTVHKQRVGRWTWREETVTDLATLRQLGGENLERCVLRLVLDLEVGMREYDEVESILEKLGGTEAAHGRAGILEVDRSRLRMAAGGAEEFPPNLPPVLEAAVERLRAREASPEGRERDVARRALFHLYKLVREGE